MSDAVLTEVEFGRFVGKAEDSPEVTDFVKSIGVPPVIENFEGERRYFTFAEHGLDIVFDKGVATGCHLFVVAEEESVRPYVGQLPHGLSFSDSRDVIMAKLGQPAKSHRGREDPRPSVHIKPWVKYNYPTHALHLQFTQDGSQIELVTLLGQP
jgi:hypothetical protein